MNKRLNSLIKDFELSEKDFKIDAKNIKKRVNASLNTDLNERKIYMKHKIFKVALAAAAITSVLATSVFAMTPTGQDLIDNIISYFQNDKAVEITSLDELRNYNIAIGISDTKNGCTLTLDNVAVDDNFLHVFYTVKADNLENRREDKSEIDTINPDIGIVCRLDGKLAGTSNHNSTEGYYLDLDTYKGVKKYNIAPMDIPDNFKLELYIDKEYKTKTYSETLKLKDEDKEEFPYVSADIDKSKVKVQSSIKTINQKIDFTDSELEKVIFSPFGNQLVMKTEITNNGKEDDFFPNVDNFALYDENNTALDILNTSLTTNNNDGIIRNSLEFLKADLNTKQLKFVPLKYLEHCGNIDDIRQKIGSYPITYQVSKNGKVVVTDILISDCKIEIDYYKDGFVQFDPGFTLLDNSGNNAEPGGKLGCLLNTKVNYANNSYTAVYEYDAYDDNGKKIPAGDDVKAENLIRNFTTLGVFSQNYIELDFDNAIIIDLEK